MARTWEAWQEDGRWVISDGTSEFCVRPKQAAVAHEIVKLLDTESVLTERVALLRAECAAWRACEEESRAIENSAGLDRIALLTARDAVDAAGIKLENP